MNGELASLAGQYATRVGQLQTEVGELRAALDKIVQAWPAHGSATDNKMADAMANIARAALAKSYP